jgi:undecaprenyl-diphosphatase
VPDRVPFAPLFKCQVAASFVDLLAPAALGGMAMTSRFLQKRGVDPAVAVAGVGLNAVAGFVAHVILLGVFLLWAGASDQAASQPISTPSAGVTFIVLGALVVFMAGAWLVPVSRKLVQKRLFPFLRDAAHGLVEVGRKPRKILALVGGSGIITLGFYGALLCAVEAFGGVVSPAEIGVAYLLASTAALVAPTPGGLGALEVALQYAFERLGMSANVALNAVLLFRAGTFWLPVLPGWLCFQSLQRHGDI